MPRKKKSEDGCKSAEPKIPKEALDQLITGPTTQSELETIYRALKKAIIERAMSAEMNPIRRSDPRRRSGVRAKNLVR